MRNLRAACAAGAPKVTAEALRAAHAVMSSAASAPSLAAFLLPGLASKCCAFLVPGGPARVSSPSQVAALQLLSCGITCALDPAGLNAAGVSSAADDDGPLGAASVLAQLRVGTSAALSDPASQAKQLSGSPDGKCAPSQHSFRVTRDVAWLRGTMSSLLGVLSQVLPPLCAHAAVSVRAALARAVAAVLQQVAVALDEPVLDLFVATALSLSQDASPSVANISTKLLTSADDDSTAQRAEQTAPAAAVRSVLLRALLRLLPSLQADFAGALLKRESEVIAAARRIAACLQALPPHIIAARIALAPAALQSQLASIAQYLALDEQLAALWLHGHSSHVQLQACMTLPAPAAVETRESRIESLQRANGIVHAGSAGAGVGGDPAGRATAERTSHQVVHQASAELSASEAIPASSRSTAQPGNRAMASPSHMPLGLKYVHTEEVFGAIAAVPCSLGHACAAARGHSESSDSALTVVDELRRAMEDASDTFRPARAPAATEAGTACMASLSNLQSWQLSCVACEKVITCASVL
jgi:hypothetical protein